MSEQPSIAENDAPAYTQEDMARAWNEGHMTFQRLGPDGCRCEAWNESECGCGLYGSNVITPNPYGNQSARAEGDVLDTVRAALMSLELAEEIVRAVLAADSEHRSHAATTSLCAFVQEATRVLPPGGSDA